MDSLVRENPFIPFIIEEPDPNKEPFIRSRGVARHRRCPRCQQSFRLMEKVLLEVSQIDEGEIHFDLMHADCPDIWEKKS